MPTRYNDADRRQWVDNDEGLYSMWKRSGMGQYKFVRTHRKEIDAIIKNMVEGNRKAHYLIYG
jgi:hypothetical protein